jgi:hypothetical protein
LNVGLGASLEPQTPNHYPLQDRLPRGRGFEQSFTDKSPGDGQRDALAAVVSDERTSTFFHLRKFGDAKVK